MHIKRQQASKGSAEQPAPATPAASSGAALTTSPEPLKKKKHKWLNNSIARAVQRNTCSKPKPQKYMQVKDPAVLKPQGPPSSCAAAAACRTEAVRKPAAAPIAAAACTATGQGGPGPPLLRGIATKPGTPVPLCYAVTVARQQQQQQQLRVACIPSPAGQFSMPGIGSASMNMTPALCAVAPLQQQQQRVAVNPMLAVNLAGNNGIAGAAAYTAWSAQQQALLAIKPAVTVKQQQQVVVVPQAAYVAMLKQQQQALLLQALAKGTSGRVMHTSNVTPTSSAGATVLQGVAVERAHTKAVVMEDVEAEERQGLVATATKAGEVAMLPTSTAAVVTSELEAACCNHLVPSGKAVANGSGSTCRNDGKEMSHNEDASCAAVKPPQEAGVPVLAIKALAAADGNGNARNAFDKELAGLLCERCDNSGIEFGCLEGIRGSACRGSLLAVGESAVAGISSDNGVVACMKDSWICMYGFAACAGVSKESGDECGCVMKVHADFKFGVYSEGWDVMIGNVGELLEWSSLVCSSSGISSDHAAAAAAVASKEAADELPNPAEEEGSGPCLNHQGAEHHYQQQLQEEAQAEYGEDENDGNDNNMEVDDAASSDIDMNMIESDNDGAGSGGVDMHGAVELLAAAAAADAAVDAEPVGTTAAWAAKLSDVFV